jgi:hypothetical protein
MNIHEDGYFVFSNKHGNRYKYFNIQKKSLGLIMFEALVQVFIVAIVFYFSYGFGWLHPPPVAAV